MSAGNSIRYLDEHVYWSCNLCNSMFVYEGIQCRGLSTCRCRSGRTGVRERKRKREKIAGVRHQGWDGGDWKSRGLCWRVHDGYVPGLHYGLREPLFSSDKNGKNYPHPRKSTRASPSSPPPPSLPFRLSYR